MRRRLRVVAVDTRDTDDPISSQEPTGADVSSAQWGPLNNRNSWIIDFDAQFIMNDRKHAANTNLEYVPSVRFSRRDYKRKKKSHPQSLLEKRIKGEIL